jgi:hypothetical protein
MPFILGQMWGVPVGKNYRTADTDLRSGKKLLQKKILKKYTWEIPRLRSYGKLTIGCSNSSKKNYCGDSFLAINTYADQNYGM